MVTVDILYTEKALFRECIFLTFANFVYEAESTEYRPSVEIIQRNVSRCKRIKRLKDAELFNSKVMNNSKNYKFNFTNFLGREIFYGNTTAH